MSAPSAKKVRLRCPDCKTRDEFPDNVTADDLPLFCDVCRFHREHELVHDARCAVCVAKLWRTRLRALLMVLLRAPAARTDEL